MKKLISIFISICIVFTASVPFCVLADELKNDDNNEDIVYDEPIRVTSLKKDNYTSKKIFVAVKEKIQLNVSVLPDNATQKELKWSISNPDAVTVSSKGCVKGIGIGRATITAKATDGSKKKIKYTVYCIKRAVGNTISMADMKLVSTGTAKYTYSQLEQELAQLCEKYPDIMSYTSLGTTYDNRNIYEVALGNKKASRHIYIQAAMHAREYLNTILTMRQIESVCANYYTGSYRNMSYCELFENVCVHVIPMMNPDGVAISQFGASAINDKKLRQKVETICKNYGYGNSSYYTNWKANARGTDLNKNYPVNWTKNRTGLGNPRSEGYKGPSYASEKETVILMNRIEELKPKAVISYHSTGSYMYWNFFQKGNHRKQCKSLFDTVYSITGYMDAEPGVTGTYKDLGPNFGSWVSAKKKIPTLTIETGTGICPLKINELDAIWNRNKFLVPAVAYWTINHSTTQISHIKSKSKGFVVEWGKRTYQTTGYVVEYATKSDFSDAVSISIDNCDQTTLRVKKLTGKKKYYVRIRTYMNVDSTRFYGLWSATSNITTKA